jgi:hypothetical protein
LKIPSVFFFQNVFNHVDVDIFFLLSAPLMQSGPAVELNNTDMDFLELPSSQEHLLMESLSQFEAGSNDATMKTVAMRHESTSRVLTERKISQII